MFKYCVYTCGLNYVCVCMCKCMQMCLQVCVCVCMLRMCVRERERERERERVRITWFLGYLSSSSRDKGDVAQVQYSRQNHEHIRHLFRDQPHNIKCMTHLCI